MSPGRPLLLMIPGLVLVLAATVEAWMLIRRGRRYDWKSFGVVRMDMPGAGWCIVFAVAALQCFCMCALRVRTAEWAMDRAWQRGVLIVGHEFRYCWMRRAWMHRAGHRVRWFRLNHAVHHRPSDGRLAAACRPGWSSPVAGRRSLARRCFWRRWYCPSSRCPACWRRRD